MRARLWKKKASFDITGTDILAVIIIIAASVYIPYINWEASQRDFSKEISSYSSDKINMTKYVEGRQYFAQRQFKTSLIVFPIVGLIELLLYFKFRDYLDEISYIAAIAVIVFALSLFLSFALEGVFF